MKKVFACLFAAVVLSTGPLCGSQQQRQSEQQAGQSAQPGGQPKQQQQQRQQQVEEPERRRQQQQQQQVEESVQQQAGQPAQPGGQPLQLEEPVILRHAQIQRSLKERFGHRQARQEAVMPVPGQLTQEEAFLGAKHQDLDPVGNYPILLEKELTDFGVEQSRFAQYRQLMIEANDQARMLQATHYELRHAYGSGAALVNVIQTMFTEKLSLFVGKPVRLRISSIEEKDMDQFFEAAIREFGGVENINDHTWRAKLLSCNFCIFAGDDWGENSFRYFMQGRNVFDPTGLIKSKIFDPLGFDRRFFARMERAFDSFKSRGLAHNFIQIFFPKERINDFSYVSLAYGRAPTDIDYRDVAGYLERYIAGRVDLQDMNKFQGRLVFLEGLYDHVKIFTYNLMNDADKQAFTREFEAVVDQAIAHWINSGAYRRLIGNPHYGQLARLIDLYVQGQAQREQQVRRVQREAGPEGMLELLIKRLLRDYQGSFLLAEPERVLVSDELARKIGQEVFPALQRVRDVTAPDRFRRSMSRLRNLVGGLLDSAEGDAAKEAIYRDFERRLAVELMRLGIEYEMPRRAREPIPVARAEEASSMQLRALHSQVINLIAQVQTAENADALVAARDRAADIVQQIGAIDINSAQRFTALFERRFAQRGRVHLEQRYGPNWKTIMGEIRRLVTQFPADREQRLEVLFRVTEKIVQDVKKIAPQRVGKQFEQELQRARATVKG